MDIHIDMKIYIAKNKMCIYIARLNTKKTGQNKDIHI